jgi:methenyltetrahydrofolate cyclohydrolase
LNPLRENQLADRALRSLLDDVASATPAPGGGSSAGWAGALAAALVEMAAGFAVKQPGPSEVRTSMVQIAMRARSLRERATDLAQRELHAYQPVLAALRLPRSDPEREARLDAALSEAAETPLAIARVCGEVTALALEASRAGSPHLRGDALAGLLIAEGACHAAATLVEINLAGRPHDERLAELAAVRDMAAANRALSSEPRSPR